MSAWTAGWWGGGIAASVPLSLYSKTGLSFLVPDWPAEDVEVRASLLGCDEMGRSASPGTTSAGDLRKGLRIMGMAEGRVEVEMEVGVRNAEKITATATEADRWKQ